MQKITFNKDNDRKYLDGLYEERTEEISENNSDEQSSEKKIEYFTE